MTPDPQNKNQNVWSQWRFGVSRARESWKLRSCALIKDISSLLTSNKTPNSHQYTKSFLLDQSPEPTTLTKAHTMCSCFSLNAPTSDLWDKPSSLDFSKNPESTLSSGEHAKKTFTRLIFDSRVRIFMSMCCVWSFFFFLISSKVPNPNLGHVQKSSCHYNASNFRISSYMQLL